MEGAIDAGERAAAEVLEELKKRNFVDPPPFQPGAHVPRTRSLSQRPFPWVFVPRPDLVLIFMTLLMLAYVYIWFTRYNALPSPSFNATASAGKEL